MKKVKVVGIGNEKIVPHKYRTRIVFKKNANIAPLLVRLVPEDKRDIETFFSSVTDIDDCPECMGMHLPESKKYYLHIEKISDDKFSLTIGHNNKKEVEKIFEETLEFPKPKKVKRKVK